MEKIYSIAVKTPAIEYDVQIAVNVDPQNFGIFKFIKVESVCQRRGPLPLALTVAMLREAVMENRDSLYKSGFFYTAKLSAAVANYEPRKDKPENAQMAEHREMLQKSHELSVKALQEIKLARFREAGDMSLIANGLDELDQSLVIWKNDAAIARAQQQQEIRERLKV